MLSFNDFVKKFDLKSKATSNIKIRKVLTSIGLDCVGIYLRDGPFQTDIGIVNLHPSRGTHWVCYLNENYFDSYGCVPPKKLSKFFHKTKWVMFIFRISDSKNDSFCASYCLYIIYVTKVLGIAFKSAVLNLYYQRI